MLLVSTSAPAVTPPRLLPTPRVVAVPGRPNVFQLLDSEVSVMPGVSGLNARKLALLCGYEGDSPVCETLPDLPAQAPRWKQDVVERGIVACSANLARGGGGLMPALARVCAARGSRLTYHTPPLPTWLRDEPTSYLATSLATGCVDLVTHSSIDEYSAFRAAASSSSTTFVPDGGQWLEAEPGVAALARAINEWWRTRPGGGLDVPRRAPGQSRKLDVVLPCGTGTTALFLQRHVPPGVQVYGVPCNGGGSGDGSSLMRRMEYLDARSGGHRVFPKLLMPPPDATCALGKVRPALLRSCSREANESLLSCASSPACRPASPPASPPPSRLASPPPTSASACAQAVTRSLPLAIRRYWRDAVYAGVFLDLLYGPVAWAALQACDWQPSSRGTSGCTDGSGAGDGADSGARRIDGQAARGELRRDVLYINTGGHEGLEYTMGRYLFAGHLNKYEFPDELGSSRYYLGQWSPKEVIAASRQMAAQRLGMVHTRNAGL